MAMTKNKPIKHSEIIERLVCDIREKNKFSDSEIEIIIEKTFECSNKDCQKHTHNGECDVLAVYHSNNHTYLEVYEVKGRYKRKNRKKAEEQLDKCACYFGQLYETENLSKWFVYGIKKKKQRKEGKTYKVEKID